ncbi:hypothetical protein [Virgibacillus sp. MG-45]|uniref:hypothetical protein n=1 Tax=Virgibacillus sp. MG-45 TaxID=3102791 RepID=UPI002EDA864E
MMEENRKDRIKIGNLNKRYMALSKAGQQADHLLKQTDKLWERINKRTSDLDERSQKLKLEYEALT